MLDEALLFRVALEPQRLGAPAGAPAATLPNGTTTSTMRPLPPIVIRVVCEGVDDPDAASALYEIRQLHRTVDFVPLVSRVPQTQRDG